MPFNRSVQNYGSSSSNRSHNYNGDVGRAVTDAVHERFRLNFIYCDNCQVKIIGNGISIHKHFNTSHPSILNCIYCPGKVFHYFKDDVNKSNKFYYHRCRDWINK
jgi:hypothetical protein